MITEDEVFLQLWIFDELKFHMAFDANFVEVDRSTGLYYDWKFMEEVYAYKFSKEKDDKLMLSNMLRSRPVTPRLRPQKRRFLGQDGSDDTRVRDVILGPHKRLASGADD